MRHKLFVLMGGFFLTAGLLMAAGCFTSPTSPSLLGQGSGAGGGTGGSDGIGGGGGLVPTPTPGTLAGGSIRGTVTNTGGAQVSIIATNTVNPLQSSATAITGDGQYIISGLADGTYEVSGYIVSPLSFSDTVQAIITNGSAVTGINLTF